MSSAARLALCNFVHVLCKVLLAKEHLLIMGIRNFPYGVLDLTQPDELRLSHTALRAMTGNGMHAASVGSFIMFVLGACDWV